MLPRSGLRPKSHRPAIPWLAACHDLKSADPLAAIFPMAIPVAGHDFFSAERTSLFGKSGSASYPAGFPPNSQRACLATHLA
jgi:hypothetical protein